MGQDTFDDNSVEFHIIKKILENSVHFPQSLSSVTFRHKYILGF